LAFTFGAVEGTIVRATITGPDGAQTVEGVIDEQGRVLLLRPINSYGTYRVEQIELLFPDGSTGTFTNESYQQLWSNLPDEALQELTVTDEESPCDVAVLDPLPESVPKLGAPPPTTASGATSTTPTTEQASSPTTEAAGSPPVTVGPTRPRGGGEPTNWVPWICILLGIILAGAGLFLLMASRRRPQRCDWAAYWELPNGQRVPLRQTPHHECCVYTFSMRTLGQSATWARKVGQDDDAERPLDLRRGGMVDVQPLLRGIGLNVDAEARSGPESGQDWMHGLGHRDQGPDDATAAFDTTGASPDGEPGYTQARPHEEQPDVVGSVEVNAEYWMTMTFSSMCRGVHGYQNYAGVLSQYEAEFECTNEEWQPECGVELAALTHLHASSRGQLTYAHDHRAAGDPDELEPVARRIAGDDGEPATSRPNTLSDLHDHVQRDRQNRTDKLLTQHTAQNFAEINNIVPKVHGESHAGMTVPLAERASTGRVTTRILARLDHLVDVQGRGLNKCGLLPPGPVGGPTPIGPGGVAKGPDQVFDIPDLDDLMKKLLGQLNGVPPGPCCDMDECLCRPSFRWTVQNGVSTLLVDGTIWTGPAGGSGAPSAGGPGVGGPPGPAIPV
jgi:hypothetical protein